MVRPERRVVLAGASPVRVSAGAPGSRLQPSGEIRPSRAGCRKPLKQREANQRAATIGERCSLVTLSAERCLGGPSRSYHGEGNRQHPGPEGMLDLFGVSGGGTLGQSNAEQERPSPAVGPSLQASPRPKALPPARRLDCAAHSVAAIQAVAEWWLATVAGNQAVRRVRAGELDSVDPFNCPPEARVFVKAVCGKTARTV
jgi:hypothetical protein